MVAEDLAKEVSALRALVREWQPTILALSDHSTLYYYRNIQELKREMCMRGTSMVRCAEIVKQIVRLEAQAELLEKLKGFSCS